MTDRFPLIVDTNDNNKIKELPEGDNLNLQGNNIVNVNNVSVGGSIDAIEIKKNGESLADIALTGDYNDLSNTPILFSGDYNDLANKPSIPEAIGQLVDVAVINPSNNQGLLYNEAAGRFEVSDIIPDIDLSEYNINELNNVIVTGNPTNKFFKYFSGAWRAANITWTDVQNKPNLISQEDLDNLDLLGGDFEGSVFADDSTLLVDGVNGLITGRSIGPIFNSDNSALLLSTADGNAFTNVISRDGNNSLLVDAENGKITGPIETTSITTEALEVTGTGTTIISSGSDIDLDATNRVKVVDTPFRVSLFTTAERDAIPSPVNGDIIYNTDLNSFQGYSNGSWVNFN